MQNVITLKIPHPFGSMRGGNIESYHSTAYHYDNASRSGADCLVIQRTLAGFAFFKDARGRTLVPAGHVMLFTHREPSSYGYPEEATEPYRLQFISLNHHGITPLFQRLRHDFGSVLRLPPGSEPDALFTEIYTRYHEHTFLDRFHEAELIHRLLLCLYRAQVTATRIHDPVEFGYHQLRNTYRRPTNLKEIAARCGISREHFIRAFTRRYGEAPGGYLRRLRLEHAQAMLQTTELPVHIVALASGFASPTTFSRAFRLHFGVPPLARRDHPSRFR